MALEKYREKRSPDRTPEPFGGVDDRRATDRAGFFVVQKHAARRLHYDFRLAMEGVLRSWAVPKGPSLNPADKRLAVMVEDHPLEYGDFEGRIPAGNYGAGAVIVWDRGTYRVLDSPGRDAAAAVRAGKLDIEMFGFKLHGAYTLVRTHGQVGRGSSADKENWLLIKKRDEYSSTNGDLLTDHPRSVLSGLTIEDLRSENPAESMTRELADSAAPRLRGGYTVTGFPLNLAKTADDPFDNDKWLFELKYDGVRALASRDGEQVRLLGRSKREVTLRYPEIALALATLPCDRFVIDGEIVALDLDGRPSFQLLQRRMHQEDPREVQRLSVSRPATLFAFDLLAFGDRDLRPLPLERRKALLASLIRGEGPVRYCDHVIGRGRDFFAATAAAGLEGIIAKRRDSPYRGIRTDDWIKIKCPRRANFVIGGWTDPAGARTHFGALLLGLYEASGGLRFISNVGTGFSEAKLRELYGLLKPLAQDESPFRKPRGDEPKPVRGSHFCTARMVAEVRFGEWTDEGGIRHPSFLKIVPDADPYDCKWPQQPADFDTDNEAPTNDTAASTMKARDHHESSRANGVENGDPARTADGQAHNFTITNPDKVFWPTEGYTKGDLIDYYLKIAPWMLPYLQDRPVVLTRYPNGIEGKSFFQKDAPAFAPHWIRTAKVWSHDTQRDIAYFLIDSAEAIGYMANLGAIPIHIWSSRVAHLERPDWLLFDIDPKGSTTAMAVEVARETGQVLREVGMRPYIKTSGQKGLHVVVGLVPEYTYEQARMFSELVARVVARRVPHAATIVRNKDRREGKTYIDYMQLGQGQTIAAPFAVRPVPGAPVSAPLKWTELKPRLDPGKWTIKTMPPRVARLRTDPFLGAIADQQRLEEALPKLEAMSGRAESRSAKT